MSIPVSPEMRKMLVLVYTLSLSAVKLLVLSEMLDIQDDCSCVIADDIIDERFIRRVQLNEDLLVHSYQPGRIWFTTKAMREFHNEIHETLAKAKLLGLD